MQYWAAWLFFQGLLPLLEILVLDRLIFVLAHPLLVEALHFGPAWLLELGVGIGIMRSCSFIVSYAIFVLLFGPMHFNQFSVGVDFGLEVKV